MAISGGMPNFLGAPLVDNGMGDLIGNALKAYKGGMEMRQAPRNNELANALKESQTNLLNAQTENEQNWGGLSKLSGPAAQAASYHKLLEIYGEDHPLVQMAKERLDSQLAHEKATTANSEMLTRTGDFRFATTPVKQEYERREVERGIMPGTGGKETLNEDEALKLGNYIDLLQFKKVTDPGTRAKLISGAQAHITKDKINPDDAFVYSGIAGNIQKKIDQGKSLSGYETEKYTKFEEQMSNLKFFRHQLRSFYGESITPTASKDLDMLINPNSWLKTPAIAKAKFKALADLFDKEYEAAQKTAFSTSAYTGQTGRTEAAIRAKNGGQKEKEVYHEKPGVNPSNKTWVSNTGKRFLEKDLQDTADKYGIPLSKVMEKLGIAQ